MSKITIEKYKRSYSVNIPFELKDEFNKKFSAEWIPDLKRWKVKSARLAQLEVWVKENQEKAIELIEASRVLKEQMAIEKTLPLISSEVKSIKIGRTDITQSKFTTSRWFDGEPEEVVWTLKCVVGTASIELENGHKLQVVVKRPLKNEHYSATTFDFNYERGVVRHDLVKLKKEVDKAFEKRVANLVAKWNQPKQHRGEWH
ncbi:hypothetical protein LCA30_02165 [Vibrio harveyi]|uniref:hypothetical protein n=1 Tax=Vibrio harveyi TaxID=669 RepID=UPI003BB763BD